MVFPTGYLHETFVDPEENDQGCFTASTFQFNHPRQVNLYRAYLSSFSMSHYGMGEPCLDRVASYATLLSMFTPPQGAPDKALIQKEAERVVKLVDADKDGQLTREDFYAYFCVGKNKRKAVMQKADFQYGWFKLLDSKQRDELIEESMEIFSEDLVQYHDIDQDAAVSLEELAASFLQWSVVQYRLAAMRQLQQKAQKPKKWVKGALKVERETLSAHYCEDPSGCGALDDLEAHAKRLQDGGKNAMARVAGQVSGMLQGDDEGDEEELTMHDREAGETARMKVGAIKGQEL